MCTVYRTSILRTYRFIVYEFVRPLFANAVKKVKGRVAPSVRNVRGNWPDYTVKFLWGRLHEEIKHLDGWLMRPLECSCIHEAAYFCKIYCYGITRQLLDLLAIIFMVLYRLVCRIIRAMIFISISGNLSSRDYYDILWPYNLSYCVPTIFRSYVRGL